MSRFNDDGDEDFNNQQRLYAQSVQNAINGKRGQTALLELEEALLAMPEKRLIEGELYREDFPGVAGTEVVPEKGGVCAVGAMVIHRKMKAGMTREQAMEAVAKKFGAGYHDTVACAKEELGLLTTLATEFAFVNDEEACACSPEERYGIVLAWVRKNLKEAK